MIAALVSDLGGFHIPLPLRVIAITAACE